MAIVEWDASPAGDVVADALIALIMHAQSSAASIRLSGKPCRHSRADEGVEKDIEGDGSIAKKARLDDMSLAQNRLQLIKDTLIDQFGKVEAVYEGNNASFEIKTDTGFEAGVDKDDDQISCKVYASFPDDCGGMAEIRVECSDKKLASNIQTCVRNLMKFTAPLS